MIANNTDSQILKEKCENDFLFFCRLVFGEKTNGHSFLIEDHHEKTAKALTDCWNGKCPRLIISMPPGFGKTTLAIYYIAWSFLKNPLANYIYISYSESRCIMSSKQIRDILDLPAVKVLWGQRIVKTESIKMWHTYERQNGILKRLGTFRLAPSDGQITGFDGGMIGQDASCGGVIIDDFIKEIDARSESMRKKSYETFVKTIRTRLRDVQAALIIIMQRLHPLDLVGCILENQKTLSKTDPEYYKLIKIQAWDKRARKPVCPQILPQKYIQDLMTTKRDLFETQYQQEPENISKDFFDIEKISVKYESKLIKELQSSSVEQTMEYVVRGWDFNYGSCEKSDYTACVKLGFYKGIFYILDVFQERAKTGDKELDLRVLVEKIVLADKTHSINWDVVQSFPDDPGYSISFDFAKKLHAQGYVVHKSRDTLKKEIRWHPLSLAINSNLFVYVQKENTDTQKKITLFNELQSGPSAQYDDQIDALSRAYDVIQKKVRINQSSSKQYFAPMIGKVYEM